MARSILATDLTHPAVPSARADAVVDFVDERIAGCPTPLRLGVRALATGLNVLSALGSRGRVDVSSPAATDVLRRLIALPLPGVADYARLVRSLTLVGWYDLDGPTAPAGS